MSAKTKKKSSVKKMDGQSYLPQDDFFSFLKSHYPESFTEGKIDPQKLKQSFGEIVNDSNERYGLSWAGKSDCFRHIQEPTTATLKPVRKESVEFDKTENIFIEGDNLQVLKVLQKSYYGKIKMIYIDPPYNTGNDSFIYPDRFQETEKEYLQRIGDKDEEGNLMRDGMFQKNSRDGGYFHSNWLSMMYPRLFLAKNLLSEDGIIFVNIDDNELHNLRMILNEIFGEENYIGMISRSTGTRMGTGSRGIARELDYVFIYSKSVIGHLSKLPMTEEELSIYNLEDERGKYLIRSLRRTGGENRREDRPSMFYPVFSPDGDKIYPIAPEGWESRWACGKETYDQLLKDGYIEWKKVQKNGEEKWQVYQKHYLSEEGRESSDLWIKDEGNKKATRDLNKLFDNRKIFDHPKSVGLMRKMIQLATEKDNNSIILDFFGGSCSLGEAVYEQNMIDGGNRKFILVQLSEACEESSEAYRAGFKTIAEIGKERIRRSGKSYSIKKKALDCGFKVYKLDDSNFKIWQSGYSSGKELENQMKMFVDNVQKGSSREDILYELILKSGRDLNAFVEEKSWKKKKYFNVDSGQLVVILEDSLTRDFIDHIIEEKPQKVICLDSAFAGNDQLKTNTHLQLESAKIDFKVI